jgi:uncharacterized protein YkwD
MHERMDLRFARSRLLWNDRAVSSARSLVASTGRVVAVIGLALASGVPAPAGAALGSLSASLIAGSGDVTGQQIVSTINAERRANGLPPVREDAGLSAGCAQYDNYRRLNGGIEDGFTPETSSGPSLGTRRPERVRGTTAC